jgi:hypothetical protein
MARDPEQRFGSADAMRAALAGIELVAAPTIAIDQATHELAPTATDPQPTTPSRQPLSAPTKGTKRHRWARVAVLAALLGAIAAALIAFTGTHDNASTQRGSATSTRATTVPTTVPTTVRSQPQTIQDLIALLRANPSAYGIRANDLRDRLQQVLTDPPGRSRQDAASLITDIGTWVSRREIDPTVGATAIRLLSGTATSPPGQENNQD